MHPHAVRPRSDSVRVNRFDPRGGTTTVETAVTLVLLLSVLFAMLDLGLLVFQSNMLSLAARRLTRESIVRGSAIDPSSTWGPNLVAGSAADGTAVAQVVSPYCVTMNKSHVMVTLSWPDGTNGIDDRVTAQLSYKRDSLTPLTSWMGTISLSANATMRIVH